jgi:hypothetical protein
VPWGSGAGADTGFGAGAGAPPARAPFLGGWFICGVSDGLGAGRRGCGGSGTKVTFGDVSWWANGWLGGLWGVDLRGSRMAVEQGVRSFDDDRRAHADRRIATIEVASNTPNG